MTRLIRPILLAAALLIAAPFTPAADKKPNDARKDLTRLFESAAATAANATVRVQVDHEDVILGTVVSADGYILTKGSELIGKEGKLKGPIGCLMRDGSTFDANVVGYNKPADLMLLKVDAEVLEPVKFAPASLAEPGNFVAVPAVVGDPKNGEVESIEVAAVGVISSASRKLYFPEDTIENSNRGFLGILFEQSGDPKNLRIQDVKNFAASRAGLMKGDSIVAANDRPVRNRRDLFDVMDDTAPGEMFTVKVKRRAKDKDADDDELTFKFKLTEMSTMDRGTMQNTMGGRLSARRGGFPKVIQHDTVLTPKQCGGPLVDLDGHVLGLNIARAGRVETWALPADVLNPLFKELKDGKYPYPATKVADKDGKADDKKTSGTKKEEPKKEDK